MFKRKTTLPNKPVEYPSGSFIKTEKGYYYIVNASKRYRITSERILRSWNPQRVILTTEAACVKYRVAAKLKYRNGSLIYNFANAKLYLISEGKRRQVMSPDVLRRIGAVGESITYASNEEVNLHEEGEPLN
jgi:hypothetical protein